MPTFVTHAFLAVTAGHAAAPPRLPRRFWLLALLCSMGPDLDTGLHHYGVAYADAWGHRGIMHSLPFAAAVSVVVVSWAFRNEAKWLSRRWWWLVCFFFILMGSHGVLDAFTNGGLGIALFAPFDHTRYFFPWRPLEVSPIGVVGFFEAGGMRAIASELLWVWLPAVVVAAPIIVARKVWGRRSRFAASR